MCVRERGTENSFFHMLTSVVWGTGTWNVLDQGYQNTRHRSDTIMKNQVQRKKRQVEPDINTKATT